MVSADDPGLTRTHALEAAITLCLTYTLCLFVVGIWMRWRSRTFGRDDVGTLIATVHNSMTFLPIPEDRMLTELGRGYGSIRYTIHCSLQ
jgi:hypothetical protein